MYKNISFFPADKINGRHEFLSKSIGVFEQELDSVKNINILFSVAVWAVPVLTLVEVVLYVIYQKKVIHQFWFETNQMSGKGGG